MMRYIILIAVLFSNLIGATETVKDTLEVRSTVILPIEVCDACSSSASGGSGFGNLMYSNFIGVRYLNQNYETKSGNFGNSPWAADQFNTYTLQGRIALYKKIAVSAQISYHNHQRELTTLKQVNADQSISGVGDAVVLGFYNLYNSTDNDSIAVKQKINFGGGVKLPTGEFTLGNSTGNNPAFQLGSGSWDYIMAIEYLLKVKKIGLSTQATYTYKTENQDGYQFGNQITYGTTLFYGIDNSEFKIFPQIGLQGEVYETNRINSIDVNNTKGDVVFGKVGVEVNYLKWGVSLNYFNPVNQNLASDNLIANNRFSVQLNYLL